MENGYHLYDYSGQLLREEHIDKFKQLLWRPRPASLLSKDAKKQIRKNLREYSKDFEEQDRIEEDKERGAVVDERRRALSEWLSWRETTVAELREEREDQGLDPEPPGLARLAAKKPEDVAAEEDEAAAAAAANGDSVNGEDGAGAAKVVEEIVEEVLDETEEIVS